MSPPIGGCDRDRGIDRLRDSGRGRFLSARGDRLRPPGRDHVHGPRLFEHVSGSAVWLRQGWRRRTLSFARRFRDGGRSGSRARLRRRRGAPGSTGRIPPAFLIRGARQFPGTWAPAIGRRGLIHPVRHAGRLCRFACAQLADPGPLRALHRGRCRRRQHQDWRDAYGLSEDDDHRAGARRTDFAWMATAGVAATLGERTTLALAWRYTDLGAVHTGRGEGRVIWHDGRREPLLLDLAGTRAKFRSHGLRLSLRYAF